MRPTRSTLVLPALLLALATACSAGSDAAAPASSSPPTSSAASPSAATPSAVSPSASAPTPSPTADVQRLQLTVKGSSVTGDTGTVDVKLGRPVQLTVTSDVADEVHVHGVDIGTDVPAGGTVVIDFTQNAPGRFEVELESRKRVLTRLQVS